MQVFRRSSPLAAAVLLLAAGCGTRGAAPVRAPSAAEAAAPAAVDDAAFAASVETLLRDGAPGPARSSLLAGTVGRQLAHAQARFASQQPARGLAAVTGALYLVRVGELRKDMLASGEPALAGAQAVVAARGDEGRSLALLELRAAVLPSGAQGDIDAHLAALRDWERTTSRGGPVEAAGRAERTLSARALLEPTPEALTAARDATIAWIERAVLFNQEQRTALGRPKREEAIEAFRAFRSGAMSLVALHLRNGDATAAVVDLDRSSARRLVPAPLYQRLERAAEGGDAASWRDLLAFLLEPERFLGEREGGDDPEIGIDPDLQRAAAFGVAVEAYRRDPSSFDAALPLAGLLDWLGMPEVAPRVLEPAAASRPDAATLGATLTLVLQSMIREDQAEDAASARRVFEAAGPLLALAERPEVAAKVQPGVPRVRLAMGMLEVKAGELAAAKAALEAAVKSEPTADAEIALAAIARHDGDAAAALAHLDRASKLATERRERPAVIEAQLAAAEVYRDTNAPDRAAAALAAALDAALDATKTARDAASRARAERLLARVLDRYGDAAGAARAGERAWTAASKEHREAAPVLLDASARALVREDLASARRTLSRAMDAELDDDDLVYVALWTALLEKQLHVPTDGSAARALLTIHDDGWPGRLAAWGLGRIKDAELLAAAHTAGAKTEATFYAAMARRAAGDAAGAAAALKAVATSPTLDLVEVQIARDLLAGPRKPLPLPPGVAVP